MTTNNPLIHDSLVLNTPATRRLRQTVESIAARDETIRAAVQAVVAGDDRALFRLILAAQAGNQDAALAALAALLPRMTGAIVKTIPNRMLRQEAFEEYISLAFLVIHDIDRDEPPDNLANKIVSRTKRRFQRHLRALRPDWVYPALAVDSPTSDTQTEDEVLTRFDLAHPADAVDNGVVSQESWRLVAAAGLGLVDGPLNERQRQRVARTRRRLAGWYALADAA